MKNIDNIEKVEALEELAQVRALAEGRRNRSAWDKGVNSYINYLLEGIEERIDYEERKPGNAEVEKWLLNGAYSWEEFSYGGSALIFDFDIAKTLCNNTELKRTESGHKQPNSRESWLDVQARALFQASEAIKGFYRTVRA